MWSLFLLLRLRPPFCTFLIATRLASFRSGNFTGGLFLDLTQVEHKIWRSSDLRIQRSADQHERSNDPKIQRSMVLTNRVLNSTKGECDVACEAVTSVVGSSNEVKPQDHIWIFQPMRIHQKFSRENTLHTQPLPSFQMLTHSSLATPLDHAPRSVRTSQ